jgi:hypothetical protein
VDCGLQYRHQRSGCDICATYIHRGVTQGVFTWFGRAGQDRHIVSYQLPNNTTILTSQYIGDLDNALMGAWGAVKKAGRRKGEVQGGPRPIDVVRGLWVAIQTSDKCILYLCNIHTQRSRSRRLYMVQPSWASSSHCKLSTAQRHDHTHLSVYWGP